MLDKQLGNIEWSKNADQIERLIRGLSPWPSAYTNWNDKVMKIWDATCVSFESNKTPGTIVQVNKDSFFVQTGKGALQIRELQILGKKRMDAGAFLRGYQVKEGEMLG
jgi:methionyl-tRNA formyltransferase